MSSERLKGFTIVETLVVVSIIVVLAGIVYVYAGPSREQSREAVCTANLRQIGLAIAMYRNDYDGTDSANTPAEYGIAPNPFTMTRYAGRSDEILHCPSADPERVARFKAAGGGIWTLYGWNVWGDDLVGRVPAWGEALRRRGSMFPIVYCREHDHPPADRPVSTIHVLILRLDGSVKAREAPREASWTW